LNKQLNIIVTCEHGGNSIPQEHLALFQGMKKLLASHKSFDSGALDLARQIADTLGAHLYYATTSRLLIDLNRSPGHPKLFSEITGKLHKKEKQQLLEHYYYPYRNKIESFIASRINKGITILHIAVHSFTPVLNGVKRRASVGLLYDPSRKGEKELSLRMQKTLTITLPRLVVRRNYPYLGRTDGLITYFRKHFPRERYLGIELEINQKHPQGDTIKWESLQREILKAVTTSLEYSVFKSNNT